MPSLGAPEIIIIAIVVLILFGSRKMPDAARSLGRSLRIFKSETRGLREDEERGTTTRELAPPVPDAVRSDDVLIDGRPMDTRSVVADPDPRTGR